MIPLTLGYKANATLLDLNYFLNFFLEKKNKVNMIEKNTHTQEKKRMKKYFSFIVHNYCFFSINMIEKLIDFNDINFNILHYLLINFISNIFILSITNNIALDKIKGFIEDGCMIIFDYLTISREEFSSGNITAYKIKYNDAIHFAYQKILTKINTVLKDSGKLQNNFKSMTTNKNMGLVLNGINLIKNIFCCLFKIQFLKSDILLLKYINISYYQEKLHRINQLINNNTNLPVTLNSNTTTIFTPSLNTKSMLEELKSCQNKNGMGLEFNVSDKNTGSPIQQLNNNDNKRCKRVDKIHTEINNLLFHNMDIIETFIVNLIPYILTCIKLHNYSMSVYNIYISYLSDYVTNTACTVQPTMNSSPTRDGQRIGITPVQTVYLDILVFIVIILLVKMNNIYSNAPYIALINKYIIHVKNKMSNQSIEQLFNCNSTKLTIDNLFNCNF